MPLTLSTYDPVLKDFWGPAIVEQLNNDIPAWKILDESARKYAGRAVVFPVHTTRNAGVGGRAEAGTLPTAGNQGHSLCTVTATYQYGRFQVSGPTLAAGKHAFAEALAMEMDGLMNDCKVDWGRQTWGDGTGRLAQIATSATAGTGSTVVPLQNRFQRAGQPGARFISIGQLVDIGSIAGGAQNISQTVSAVSVSLNPATTTDSITLGNSAATFSSSQQWVYNQGSYGSGGVGIEMMGIQGIVDVFTEANMWGSNAFWSANLHGIARSAVTSWNANVLGNSGTTRVLDSLLMQTGFDQIHTDTGQEADLIWCQHSVARVLFDSLVGDRRFASTVFEGGYSKLTYNGVVVQKDRLAPYQGLFIGVRSTLQKFTMMPVQFIDKDGAILSRVANQDNFEGFIAYYGNLGLEGNMKSLLMIRDIRVDI